MIHDHPILAALTAMAALVVVLILSCCRIAARPGPHVHWDKNTKERD